MTVGDPSVIVRTLGTRREFGARQAFVTNLLAAAGIRATDEGSRSPSSRPAPRPTPATGPARSPTCAPRSERVLVAGRASELGDAADQVDGEVHDGIDVVAFLSDLLDQLGAPPDPTTAATATSTEGSR